MSGHRDLRVYFALEFVAKGHGRQGIKPEVADHVATMVRKPKVTDVLCSVPFLPVIPSSIQGH